MYAQHYWFGNQLNQAIVSWCSEELAAESHPQNSSRSPRRNMGECAYNRIHATVCERDVNREVIERALEVDAMPEVEQKKELVEDPADDKQ